MAVNVYHTLKINQQRYHIQSTKVTLPEALTEILGSAFDEPFIPATAVTWNESNFDDADLQETCRTYEVDDDVWCQSFCSCEDINLNSISQQES